MSSSSAKAKQKSDPGAGWASSALRRTVVALAGGAAAGLFGMGVAETLALKPIKPIHVLDKPTVIDGPPTDVEPAPPPVALQHRHARPPPDTEDAELEDLSDTHPAGPPPAVGEGEAGGPCGQLESQADRLVCSTPSLAAADETLQGVYRMALADSDDPAAVTAEQMRWREARDRVAASQGADGLAEIYDARIRELTGPPGG
jgi:hypothetical protein